MKSTISTVQAQFIIDNKGKKTGVILDIETFEQMVEELEELYLGKWAEDVLKSDLQAGKPQYTLAEIKQNLLPKKKALGLVAKKSVKSQKAKK